MIRVLIPTDLSDEALRAADLTIRSLGTSYTQYVLVHAYFPQGLAASLPSGTLADIQKAAEEGLAGFEQRLRARFPGEDLVMRHATHHGPLSAAVDREAGKNGIDLVVLYTHRQATPMFLGSNATDVMRTSHVPVLELPIDLKELSIRRVLFADDGWVIDPSALEILVTLAHRMKAEVIIAHVAAGRPMKEQVDHRYLFDQAFKGLSTREITIENDDVTEALLNVAEREQVHLVAVLHRHEGWTHDLFHRSITRKIGLESRIPVLALEQ